MKYILICSIILINTCQLSAQNVKPFCKYLGSPSFKNDSLVIFYNSSNVDTLTFVLNKVTILNKKMLTGNNYEINKSAIRLKNKQSRYNSISISINRNINTSKFIYKKGYKYLLVTYYKGKVEYTFSNKSFEFE